MNIKTEPLINSDRVVIHSTTENLDGILCTVVGRVTMFNHYGDIYIVRPDVKIGDYECLSITNSCLKRVDEDEVKFPKDIMVQKW